MVALGMMKNKSTIARLLAEEDIHVVNKKMDTAYFNIKKRELGLPIWKDEISKWRQDENYKLKIWDYSTNKTMSLNKILKREF